MARRPRSRRSGVRVPPGAPVSPGAVCHRCGPSSRAGTPRASPHCPSPPVVFRLFADSRSALQAERVPLAGSAVGVMAVTTGRGRADLLLARPAARGRFRYRPGDTASFTNGRKACPHQATLRGGTLAQGAPSGVTARVGTAATHRDGSFARGCSSARPGPRGIREARLRSPRDRRWRPPS